MIIEDRYVEEYRTVMIDYILWTVCKVFMMIYNVTPKFLKTKGKGEKGAELVPPPFPNLISEHTLNNV